MYTDISTQNNYPKTLVIRNTPEGMIWQIYHVNNLQEAEGLASIAKSNGFYGITLEDYQPEHVETWPGWRVNADPAIIGEDYVLTEQDHSDYQLYLDSQYDEDYD
jgi:hypothetical protein